MHFGLVSPLVLLSVNAILVWPYVTHMSLRSLAHSMLEMPLKTSGMRIQNEMADARNTCKLGREMMWEP